MRTRVVDDDEIFCRMLVELRAEIGMGAVCSTGGFAACELMNRESYDLGIIDMRTPLIWGADLAAATSEDHPQINIILGSAFPDRALREYAARKGIFPLSKPFTKMELFDKVQAALGGSIGRN